MTNNRYLSKKILFLALLLGALSAVVPYISPDSSIVLAQNNNDLTLSLARDFGYSSGTGEIQGTFTMKISSTANLQKVVFFIDDIAVGEDNQPPFRFQFNTGNYSLSAHTLFAIGYNQAGEEIKSNEIIVKFVSADEGWQSALKIAIPIIGLTLAGILISYGLTFIFQRGKSQKIVLPDRFGILGGAICPKCHLPFSIPLFKINLVAGSLLPCPYCRKWIIVRPAGKAELEAALENAKSQNDTRLSIHPPEEALLKEIDDSRYMDQ